MSLKRRGYRLWGIESSPDVQPIYEAASVLRGSPIVLVVGHEVTGIDPGIIALCDNVFQIPMQGYKRSLNVAVAFGIAAYLLRHGLPERNDDRGNRVKTR
jgi:tRNA G18 (ribose-2'-O)-methylase SpoU